MSDLTPEDDVPGAASKSASKQRKSASTTASRKQRKPTEASLKSARTKRESDVSKHSQARRNIYVAAAVDLAENADRINAEIAEIKKIDGILETADAMEIIAPAPSLEDEDVEDVWEDEVEELPAPTPPPVAAEPETIVVPPAPVAVAESTPQPATPAEPTVVEVDVPEGVEVQTATTPVTAQAGSRVRVTVRERAVDAWRQHRYRWWTAWVCAIIAFIIVWVFTRMWYDNFLGWLTGDASWATNSLLEFLTIILPPLVVAWWVFYLVRKEQVDAQ